MLRVIRDMLTISIIIITDYNQFSENVGQYEKELFLIIDSRSHALRFMENVSEQSDGQTAQ